MTRYHWMAEEVLVKFVKSNSEQLEGTFEPLAVSLVNSVGAIGLHECDRPEELLKAG